MLSPQTGCLGNHNAGLEVAAELLSSDCIGRLKKLSLDVLEDGGSNSNSSGGGNGKADAQVSMEQRHADEAAPLFLWSSLHLGPLGKALPTSERVFPSQRILQGNKPTQIPSSSQPR